MAWSNPDSAAISKLLKEATTIAVYGCSPKPDRTSYRITAYLIRAGYRVYPVHPKAEDILGQKVYPDLASIPEHINIVNVFRKAEFTPEVARQAAAINADCLWLQLGIINETSWQTATQAGLPCIMDRCIAVEHQSLLKV